MLHKRNHRWGRGAGGWRQLTEWVLVGGCHTEKIVIH